MSPPALHSGGGAGLSPADGGQQIPHLLPGELGRQAAVQTPVHVAHQGVIAAAQGRSQQRPQGSLRQPRQIFPGGLLPLAAAVVPGAPLLQLEQGGPGRSGVSDQIDPDPQTGQQPGAAERRADHVLSERLLQRPDPAAIPPDPPDQRRKAQQHQGGQSQKQQNPQQLGIDGMSTSLGGIPGEIEPGEWKAAICCFSEYIDQYLGDAEFDIVVRLSDKFIPAEESVGERLWCSGDYDFERLFQQKEGWFCGDFHTHTRLSDGKETVRCAMKKAGKMGMDFYVPTEHNVVHTGWPETDIMILPGVEITTCLGHFNIFGCTGAPAQLLDIMKEAGEEDIWKKMKYTIRECEKNGWLWSINHPFLHISLRTQKKSREYYLRLSFYPNTVL